MATKYLLAKLQIRRNTKNNLPNLAILFPLLCSKFHLNPEHSGLFLKKFILIKENIMANLGTLFFVLRLKKTALHERQGCLTKFISLNQYKFSFL
jgi:hypothetical protein